MMRSEKKIRKLGAWPTFGKPTNGTLNDPPPHGYKLTCAACGRTVTVCDSVVVVRTYEPRHYAVCWTVYCDKTCEGLGHTWSQYCQETRRREYIHQLDGEIEVLRTIDAAGKLTPDLVDRLAILSDACRICKHCGTLFVRYYCGTCGEFCRSECWWQQKIDKWQRLDDIRTAKHRANGIMSKADDPPKMVYPTCAVCGCRTKRMRAIDAVLNPVQLCRNHKGMASDIAVKSKLELLETGNG